MPFVGSLSSERFGDMQDETDIFKTKDKGAILVSLANYLYQARIKTVFWKKVYNELTNI